MQYGEPHPSSEDAKTKLEVCNETILPQDCNINSCLSCSPAESPHIKLLDPINCMTKILERNLSIEI